MLMSLYRLPTFLMFGMLLLMLAFLVSLPAKAFAKPSIKLISTSASTTLPKAKTGFPHPNDPNQLFFVQRTSNANTIVYAAQFDANGELNKRRPVIAYWRRYAEQGQTMPLRWYERVFGFGVRARRNPKGDGYFVSFNAMRNHTVELRQSGPFEASLWTRYNNRDFELVYGYLDLDEKSLLPKVDRLRLYTTTKGTRGYFTHLIAVSGGEYQE